MCKSQLLIDQMLECIRQGQPKCVVVCANYEHLRYLMDKVCETLNSIGESFILGKRKSIFIDEAEITFTTVYKIDIWRCRHQGYGEFWDNYAEWTYEQLGD